MKKFLKFLKSVNYRKLLFANYQAKIASILTAMLLWVAVASSQGTLGKLPGKIQIKAINVTDGMVAVYDQKEVEVQILADPSIWEKLSASSFAAYVDLAGLGEGTYEIDVQVTTTVKDVQIVSKTPQTILVSIEELISKEVNINTRVEGSAGEGLVAGNIELEPSSAVVSGPESIVENVTEASAQIILNGESEDFEKIVNIVAYSNSGEVIDNITFTPDQVLANVSIVKASNNKTVGVKVNTNGSPAENYFISKITVVPNTIDITGPLSVLQLINYIETERINIASISSNLETTARLVIPNGAALQSGEGSSVKVTLIVEKADTSKTISVPVSFQNIPDGMEVSSLSSERLSVSIIGSQETINKISESDFSIEIDLSGLNSGNNSVDITKDNIKFNKNVSVTDFEPKKITFVLN